MKATLLATALLAVAGQTAASVLPRDAADDGLTEPQDLADLLAQARSQVIGAVEENEQQMRKRGETPRCTTRNLVFRRE
jgi:tyrosinase